MSSARKAVVALVLALLAPLANAGQYATAKESEAAALTQFAQGHYQESLALFREAIELGDQRADLRYNAACAAAKAGELDAAFDLLEQSVDAGFHDVEGLQRDSDLASLKTAPRWTGLVAMVSARHQEWSKSNNAELAGITDADQTDRREHPGDLNVIAGRDALRLTRVKEIVASGALSSAQDYYNAALVLQHGVDVTDYALAHRLASRAVQLDPKLPNARWLAAATKDRWLLKAGKPQQYGTQMQREGGDGAFTLEPIDHDAVSDDDRRAAGILAYPQLLEMVGAMNAQMQSAKKEGKQSFNFTYEKKKDG